MSYIYDINSLRVKSALRMPDEDFKHVDKI